MTPDGNALASKHQRNHVSPVPTKRTDDLRIGAIDPLISPAVLSYYLPTTREAADLVHNARVGAEAILGGEDDRLLVVIGPCSIHDPSAALEYGSRLRPLIEQFSEDLPAWLAAMQFCDHD